MLEILDCEQGSDDWFRCRMGLPTASEFACLLVTKGRGENGESIGRKRYLHRLAAEIVSGQPVETYRNAYMDRGRAQEAEARWHYGFVHDVDLERVGFIRNGQKGASPDALIGTDGGLEIKTREPPLQVELLLSGNMPTEHVAQLQGNIWVAEREWWDLAVYAPGLPMLVKRAFRDEPYIKRLAVEVDRFNEELQAIVEKVRGFGMPQPSFAQQLKMAEAQVMGEAV